METKIKTIITLLTAFTLGCSYIPKETALRQIEESPYMAHMNDCKHKAVTYHRILQESNLTSRVVSGELTNGQDHAWVEVFDENNERWVTIDPTHTGILDGYPARAYPDRSIDFIYHKNVSIEDIIKKRNLVE